jgi:hypothetical protein
MINFFNFQSIKEKLGQVARSMGQSSPTGRNTIFSLLNAHLQ